MLNLMILIKIYMEKINKRYKITKLFYKKKNICKMKNVILKTN